MKKHLGFTLSELMIAMLVLGILLAVTMPIMSNKKVNQNKIFIKKAYYAASEVIAELINDDSLYANLDGYCPETGDTGYVGFDCLPTNTTPNQNYYGKLAYNFANKLNTIETITLKSTGNSGLATDSTICTKYQLDGAFCYAFNTTDGIYWMFPGSKQDAGFPKGSTSSAYTIGIDVNGSDTGPNCYQGSTATGCSGKTDGFDQFRINIYADGKIEIPATETWAIDAIQISSSLTGK